MDCSTMAREGRESCLIIFREDRSLHRRRFSFPSVYLSLYAEYSENLYYRIDISKILISSKSQVVNDNNFS